MKQITASLVLIALLCSCTTTSQFFTPPRVQAVVSLGSYFGGQTLIKDGHRMELAQLATGLQTLKDANISDLPAITEAVTAALGVDADGFVNSDEGMLIFTGTTLLFTDLWSGSGQKVLDSKYGVAVRDGMLQGANMALGPAVRALSSTGQPDPGDVILRKQAAAARPQGIPK